MGEWSIIREIEGSRSAKIGGEVGTRPREQGPVQESRGAEEQREQDSKSRRASKELPTFRTTSKRNNTERRRDAWSDVARARLDASRATNATR